MSKRNLQKNKHQRDAPLGRAEDGTIYRELEYPTKSVFNRFENLGGNSELGVNAGLAANGYSNAHQDPYCSDSLSASGPVSDTLKIQRRANNDLGKLAVMTCNANGVMIGASVNWATKAISVVGFNPDSLDIIAEGDSNSNIPEASLRGGYCFLGSDDNLITLNSDGTLSKWDTADLSPGQTHTALETIWTTQSLPYVDVATGVYLNSVLPVASPDINTNQDLYWIVLSTDVDNPNGVVFVYQLQISANGNIGIEGFPRIYQNHCNNNTIASVADEGLYLILSSTADSLDGSMLQGQVLRLDGDGSIGSPNEIHQVWSIPYDHVPFVKFGLQNTGSGTTVTLMDHPETNDRLVVFADNAEPQTNLHVYKNRHLSAEDLERVGEPIPWGRKMRSGTEASMIGYKDTIILSSNIGNQVSKSEGRFQNVPNEPGISLFRVNADCTNVEEVWTADLPINTSFGMPQLEVTNGILYVFSGIWSGDTFDNPSEFGEAPKYYFNAYDAHDGRIIWQVPLGEGFDYAHEYGGIYQSQNTDPIAGANPLFVGGNYCIYRISDAP